PAAVHRILPTDSKVLTIDLSVSQETRARARSLVNSVFPPGRQPLSQIADIQGGFARNSSNGQISRDCEVVLAFELNLIARKGDLRIMVHIKKVCASQVVVTLFHSRPDSPDINLYCDGRIARAIWIKLERAVNVFEMSA